MNYFISLEIDWDIRLFYNHQQSSGQVMSLAVVLKSTWLKPLRIPDCPEYKHESSKSAQRYLPAHPDSSSPSYFFVDSFLSTRPRFIILMMLSLFLFSWIHHPMIFIFLNLYPFYWTLIIHRLLKIRVYFNIYTLSIEVSIPWVLSIMNKWVKDHIVL